MKLQTILKKINNIIQVGNGILKEILPIVIQELKKFYSENFEVHTEKVEYVQIL